MTHGITLDTSVVALGCVFVAIVLWRLQAAPSVPQYLGQRPCNHCAPTRKFPFPRLACDSCSVQLENLNSHSPAQLRSCLSGSSVSLRTIWGSGYELANACTACFRVKILRFRVTSRRRNHDTHQCHRICRCEPPVRVVHVHLVPVAVSLAPLVHVRASVV